MLASFRKLPLASADGDPDPKARGPQETPDGGPDRVWYLLILVSSVVFLVSARYRARYFPHQRRAKPLLIRRWGTRAPFSFRYLNGRDSDPAHLRAPLRQRLRGESGWVGILLWKIPCARSRSRARRLALDVVRLNIFRLLKALPPVTTTTYRRG